MRPIFSFFSRFHHSLAGLRLLAAFLCTRAAAQSPVYTCQVVEAFPHDKKAFCQGLVFHQGHLYESTGLYGKSSVRKVNPANGKVLHQVTLPSNVFGEGLTICNNNLVQLTWLSHVGFVRDLADFHVVRSFSYPGQGWGITFDGKRLVMSDGTSTLYFMNPKTFERTDQITVKSNGQEVRFLNELEFVKGEIYANVWQSDSIAIIHPESGQVRAWIDCSPLRRIAQEFGHCEVLNGIAYHPDNDCLFITGKFWPRLFEVRLMAK